MTAKATGLPFTFEMLCATREQERLMLAYSSALRQIGIDAQVRMIDSAQYQRRSTSFDFDMMQASWGSSLSPGNEQNFRWSAASADQDGSYNYAGVKSEGVDAMIAAMLKAGHARGVRLGRPRARPAFAFGPLWHPALLRAQAMDRGVVAFAPAARLDALRGEARNLVGGRREKHGSEPAIRRALKKLWPICHSGWAADTQGAYRFGKVNACAKR